MKRLFIISFFALTACANPSHSNKAAAHLFQGVVTDVHSIPVAGASIQAMSFNSRDYGIMVYGETVTDSSGRFSLTTTTTPDTLQISKGNLYAVVHHPGTNTKINAVMKKRGN